MKINVPQVLDDLLFNADMGSQDTRLRELVTTEYVQALYENNQY